ncbi:MAG: hypothetical protein ABJ275_11465 [Maricaulaceae bacterium]
MTKISKLLSQTFESYKLAFLFIMIALPLALVPVLGEGLQHFVEYKLGMFALKKGDDFGDKAHAIRIAFGAIKILSLLFIMLVLPRFFMMNRNKKTALSFTRQNGQALLKGLIVVLVMVVWTFFIGPIVLSFLIPSLSELKALLLILFTPFLLGMIFTKPVNNWLTSLWGFPLPTPTQHKAINKTLYGPGFMIQIAAIFPAMALHYWLGFNAMGQSGATLATLLVVDSIVVGVLACLMAACIFVPIRDIYEHTEVDKN